MQFHRETSRYYQLGNDNAHAAADQALVAHGQTLKAMDHWQKASAEYSGHGVALFPTHDGPVEPRRDPWAEYMVRLFMPSPEKAATVAPRLSGVAIVALQRARPSPLPAITAMRQPLRRQRFAVGTPNPRWRRTMRCTPSFTATRPRGIISDIVAGARAGTYRGALLPAWFGAALHAHHISN